MQRRGGRWVRLLALLTGLVLAVAATAALVLTDDLQLLRLAVVGALWAFLIAAFVAGQRRNESADEQTPPGTEVALRRSHELELQREVGKRREFELLTEVRLRREIETSLRADLGALRGDLDRLRHDILQRWDGELRVERIAVRAESTRFTGLGALTALHDEARRLQGESSRREVEPRHSIPDAAGAPEASTVDAASTVEFSIVPSGPSPSAAAARVPHPDDTGPVYGFAPRVRVPPPVDEPAVDRPVSDDSTDEVPVVRAPPLPGARPGAADELQPAGRRHRSRHGAAEGGAVDGVVDGAGVDASALVERLRAESAPTDAPRRRRARADDEPNDVLTRVLGGG